MERFSILVNGEVQYHSPKDYGDDVAEGEAPVRIDHWLKESLGGRISNLASLSPGESIQEGAHTITRAGGDVCRIIDVTFDTVSEESASEGDTERRGWRESILITREDLDLDDNDQPDTSVQGWADATIRAIQDEHPGSLEADSSHGVPRWLGESDAQVDEERRDFHFEDGGFTDEEIVAIARGLGVRVTL